MRNVQVFIVRCEHQPLWIELAVDDPEARFVLKCVSKFLKRPSDAAVDCLVCGQKTPHQPQTVVVILGIPPSTGTPPLAAPLCRKHADDNPARIAHAAARYLGGYVMPHTAGTA